MIAALRHHAVQFDSNHPAIIEATGEMVSYGELLSRVESISRELKSITDRTLVFLHAGQDSQAIVFYLACLYARFPVCLLDPNASSELNIRQLAAYRPGLVIRPGRNESLMPENYARHAILRDYEIIRQNPLDDSIDLHPDLALLLATSGSTGDPKLVRLSEKNVIANAESICDYLELSPEERPIASLPIHYSYGLSVLNSHLVSGGTLVLTSRSFLKRDFWQDVDERKCTSFAGVPIMYETLGRLGFDPARHATLRTLTQAGGPLRPDIIRYFHVATEKVGAKMFAMYGQTEATARIAYVPPKCLADKAGAIGIPIPGGQLQLRPLLESDQLELVYSGPNVMLGYANSQGSLALGDELKGILPTGDIGVCDADGFFYVTGRLRRFAKIHGRRINLVDVEMDVEQTFQLRTATMEENERIVVFVVGTPGFIERIVGQHLARRLNIPPRNLAVICVESLPLTSSGKKDYKALAALRAA